MATSTLFPNRAAWREAVAAIAAKAHAKLPECNGRIDSAVKLVLLGEVTLLPDGTATVGSCSDPTKSYTVNGTCPCKDSGQAPGNLCKHRLAYGIARRAQELVGQAPEPREDSNPSAQTLPEAPASVNVHLELSGRMVHLTLRDHDEARLLVRLEAVLQRSPQPQPPAQASSQGQGWCAKHQVAMKQTVKDGRSWWSHRTGEGWCKGR